MAEKCIQIERLLYKIELNPERVIVLAKNVQAIFYQWLDERAKTQGNAN